MKLHSTVGLITNSSTELYMRATTETVTIINNLIKHLELEPTDYVVSIRRKVEEKDLEWVMEDHDFTKQQAYDYIINGDHCMGDDYIVIQNKDGSSFEIKDLFEAQEVMC